MLATFARFLLGLTLAAGVYALAVRIDPRVGQAVDPFLVLAIYHSLRHTPTASALGGSVCGLTQDALTGGLFGLHGFANTLVAFLCARIQQRMVIQQPVQVGFLCLLASGLQLTLLSTLQFAMVPMAEMPTPAIMLARMVTTAILGGAVFATAAKARDGARQLKERRRRRPHLHR